MNFCSTTAPVAAAGCSPRAAGGAGRASHRTVPPGMPPIGLPYGNYFAAMKARLNMTPAQDAQYTVALTATVKANDARKARTVAAEAVKAELAKAEPNFERLLNMREEFAELSANERKGSGVGVGQVYPDAECGTKGNWSRVNSDRVSRREPA